MKVLLRCSGQPNIKIADCYIGQPNKDTEILNMEFNSYQEQVQRDVKTNIYTTSPLKYKKGNYKVQFIKLRTIYKTRIK